jgi:hypothetical protein
MAFGVKHDAASGHSVDHDRIYRELIVPAVQEAGLACQRADDFAGSLIHKDIAKAVITADVMLADVSNGNANVIYELGIRHALRRGATVLLSSTPLPFNIAHNYALRYDVAPDGGPEPARLEAIRAQLADVRPAVNGAAPAFRSVYPGGSRYAAETPMAGRHSDRPATSRWPPSGGRR